MASSDMLGQETEMIGLQEALSALGAGDLALGLRQLVKDSDDAKDAFLEVLSELITSEISEASLSPLPLLDEISDRGLAVCDWDRVLTTYENTCPLLLACLRATLAARQGQTEQRKDQGKVEAVKSAVGVILSLIFYMAAPESFQIKSHIDTLVSWLPQWEKQMKGGRITRSGKASSPCSSKTPEQSPTKRRRTPRHNSPAAQTFSPKTTTIVSSQSDETFGSSLIENMEMSVTDDDNLEETPEPSLTLLTTLKHDAESGNDLVSFSVKQEPSADQSESMIEEFVGDLSDDHHEDLDDKTEGNFPDGETPDGNGPDPDGELVEFEESSSQLSKGKGKKRGKKANRTSRSKKRQVSMNRPVEEEALPEFIVEDEFLEDQDVEVQPLDDLEGNLVEEVLVEDLQEDQPYSSEKPSIETHEDGTQWVTVGGLTFQLDAETMNSDNIIVVLEEPDGQTTLAIPDDHGNYTYPSVSIPEDDDQSMVTIPGEMIGEEESAVTILNDITTNTESNLIDISDRESMILASSEESESNAAQETVTIKTEPLDGKTRVKAKDGKFSCKSCGKTFSRVDNLSRHMKGHEGAYKHKCELCGKFWRDKTMLKSHIATEHEDVRLRCDQCFKSFKSRSGLQTHLKLHEETFEFVCKYCGQGFVNKQLLEGHTNSKHINAKPHVCKCGRRFAWIANFTSHKKKCSPDRLINRIPCTMCDKFMKNRLSYQRHLASHMNNKDSFRCATCGKCYSHSNSLLAHVKKCRVWMK